MNCRVSQRDPERRSYRQYCGVARALDLVGERWTLLLVRNLLLGPRRYSDLLAELPGITTNLLARRLRDLEEAGLIERDERPRPAPASLYRLTADGAALEPVIMELGRWGGRYLGAPRRDDTLDIGWALLSMKRRYRGGLTAVVALDLGERRFELAFRPDYLAVQERDSPHAALRLSGSADSIRKLWWLGVPAEQLRRDGALVVDGPEPLWADLLAAFAPLPAARRASGA
jgi:DNA-binding HxlR family transcriptional regulator